MADIINATSELVANTSSLVNITNSTYNSIILKTLSDPIFLTFGLSVLLVTVILIFIIRNVTPVSHFLYADARVQAMSNYMVTDPYSLAESKSLSEFCNSLKNTSWGEGLEKSADLRTLHHALEKSYVNDILELIALSPVKSKPLFDSYLQFLEAKILKSIYRARMMRTKVRDIFVYPVGKIDSVLLNHLLETKTIADIGVVMKPTHYADVFEKEYKSLQEFEVALDSHVYDDFVDSIRKTKMYDGKNIIEVLNTKIDILNILALLKFRVRVIPDEEQKDLLIHNKSSLCERFDKLINAITLKEFTVALKGLPYYEPMEKALKNFDQDSSFLHFENELYRYFKNFVVSQELSHTLGPYPLFSYLLRREINLRNLFVISRGIDVGFSVERIREMII